MTTRSRVSSSVLSVLPWILLAVVFLAWAPGVIYDRWSQEVTTPLDKLWALSFMAFPLVGAFLARRIPSNPVGWLFLIGPALVGAGVSIGEYGEAVGLDLVTLSDGVFAVGLVAMFSSILLFPDGHYPNRWYRWAHAVGLAGLSISPLLGAEATGPAIAFNFLLPTLALIHRLIRGDSTVRRQFAGPVLVALLGLFMIGLSTVVDVDTTSGGIPVEALIGTLASMTLSVGIPVSIAFAITRYRLYEIDRIVSRTVSYVLVVGLLAAVFFGVVTAASSVLPTDSDLAIAASTLAVAALFNPVRRRVQVWVDRRFNRSRYDAQRVMDRFSRSLRDQVDPDRVIDGWVGVVAETMQPVSAGIWVRNDFGTVE